MSWDESVIEMDEKALLPFHQIPNWAAASLLVFLNEKNSHQDTGRTSRLLRFILWERNWAAMVQPVLSACSIYLLEQSRMTYFWARNKISWKLSLFKIYSATIRYNHMYKNVTVQKSWEFTTETSNDTLNISTCWNLLRATLLFCPTHQCFLFPIIWLVWLFCTQLEAFLFIFFSGPDLPVLTLTFVLTVTLSLSMVATSLLEQYPPRKEAISIWIWSDTHNCQNSHWVSFCFEGRAHKTQGSQWA